MIDIRQFGAIGDGIHSDTAVIQQAIDTCASNGGGVVYFPPGRYLSGSIYLRDRITLRLEDGATLLAATQRGEYNDECFCPQNYASVEEKTDGTHLVIALECNEVAIEGLGVIDGRQSSFYPDTIMRHEFNGRRPSQMLFFCECRNVRLEGVHLVNSAYWSCFLYGCDDVTVSSLRITVNMSSWNGDGLDVDCCHNVKISDCVIRGSDDCIAIRADGARLRKHANICDDIEVSYCLLSTRQAAIRVGVGTGIIKHCSFHHLNVLESGTGLTLLSTYLPEIFPRAKEGVTIEDIRFYDCDVKAMVMFDLNSNHVQEPMNSSQRTISNVRFENIRGENQWTSFFRGNRDRNVKDIWVKNVKMLCCGGKQLATKALPHEGPYYHHTVAVIVENIAGIHFQDCSFAWKKDDYHELWEGTISTNLTRNDFELTGCSIEAPENGVPIVYE